MDPRAGTGRLVRLTVFCLVAMLVSVGAHVAAGGDTPGSGALLVAAVPVVLTAVHLSAHRRSTTSLAIALGTLQVGLHLVFHTAADATSPWGASGAGTGGHLGHTAHLATLAPTPIETSGAWTGASPPGAHLGVSPAMVVAHALAVVALAWLMARGEDLLWRVTAAVLVTLPGLVRVTRSPGSPTVGPRPLGRGLDVVSAAGLRGPPALARA